MKEEGTPFSTVLDKSQDEKNVMKIPSSMAAASKRARDKEVKSPVPAAKNMVRTAKIVGNLPLQGTRLLVSMAIRRSLGESMMRQPVTPAALHPKPMHMVRRYLDITILIFGEQVCLPVPFHSIQSDSSVVPP